MGFLGSMKPVKEMGHLGPLARASLTKSELSSLVLIGPTSWASQASRTGIRIQNLPVKCQTIDCVDSHQ